MPAKPKASNRKPRFTRQQRQIVYKMISEDESLAAISRSVQSTPRVIRKHFAKQLADRPEAKRGRKPRVWTHEERVLVAVVLAIGIDHASVASLVGLGTAEFRRTFTDEIRTSKASLDARIGARIAELALAGDAQLLRFYARSQMGWNDRPAPEAPTPPAQAQAALLRPMIEALDPAGRAAYRLVLAQMGTVSPLTGDGPTAGDPLH